MSLQKNALRGNTNLFGGSEENVKAVFELL